MSTGDSGSASVNLRKSSMGRLRLTCGVKSDNAFLLGTKVSSRKINQCHSNFDASESIDVKETFLKAKQSDRFSVKKKSS